MAQSQDRFDRTTNLSQVLGSSSLKVRTFYTLSFFVHFGHGFGYTDLAQNLDFLTQPTTFNEEIW